MAILKPLPFLPSRRSAGIRQSSMINSQVEEPRIPIFFFVLTDREAGIGALYDESGDLLAGLLGVLLIGNNAGNGDDDEHIGISRHW